MKKLSNILATTIVALFLLSFGMKSEAMGQCPSGYTHHLDTLLVQGCYYEIDICVQCTATHPGKVEVNDIKKLDDSCSDTLDANETLQQVLSQVSNWAYVYFDVCQYNIPPCDINDPREVTFKYSVCWYMLKDTINNQTWYIPCSDEVCEVTYELCMKPDLSIQRTITNIIPPILPYSCELEGFEVEEPDEHDETSECFILHTPCNPDGGWIAY